MKKLLCFILFLLLQPLQCVFAEREIDVHYFHDIAITNIDNHDKIDTEKLSKKIVIQKIISPTYEEIKETMGHFSVPKIKLGETIWEITPEMLPANNDTCLNNNIDTCDEEPFRPHSLSACYNGCVNFGASFLAYDKNNKKVYLLADTVEVGQGGGPFLAFVADLKTKQIKFLREMNGYVSAKISPDGRHMLLTSLNGETKFTVLKIYNTETNKVSVIEKSIPITDLKWINDQTYSYRSSIIKNGITTKSYKTVVRHV